MKLFFMIENKQEAKKAISDLKEYIGVDVAVEEYPSWYLLYVEDKDYFSAIKKSTLWTINHDIAYWVDYNGTRRNLSQIPFLSFDFPEWLESEKIQELVLKYLKKYYEKNTEFKVEYSIFNSSATFYFLRDSISFENEVENMQKLGLRKKMFLKNMVIYDHLGIII